MNAKKDWSSKLKIFIFRSILWSMLTNRLFFVTFISQNWHKSLYQQFLLEFNYYFLRIKCHSSTTLSFCFEFLRQLGKEANWAEVIGSQITSRNAKKVTSAFLYCFIFFILQPLWGLPRSICTICMLNLLFSAVQIEI